MVGIVLHVKTNKRLRDAVYYSHRQRTLIAHPTILHKKEQGDIAEGSEIPPKSPEFPSPANNFENLLLDFALEGGIKFVTGMEECSCCKWTGDKGQGLLSTQKHT